MKGIGQNMDNLHHKFTSTGQKLWCHSGKMISYLKETGQSIISTHISPHANCNLHCAYCSVENRDRTAEIPLEVILDYVDKLRSRGLKAVIITGGGEPTLYRNINTLISELSFRDLKIGLITNGSLSHNVETWHLLTWVRISINQFPMWEERIMIPYLKLASGCTVGCSMIENGQPDDVWKRAVRLLDKVGAKYLRISPNCLCSVEELMLHHARITFILNMLNDKRIFHHHKVYRNPSASVCHQSYFRPYLSEVDGGTVFPCDSLVLHSSQRKFGKRYALCKAGDILDFLDGKIVPQFSPNQDCPSCMFVDTVEMLETWKTTHRAEHERLILEHEEFV